MVGVPGRSRACKSCKERRVACDLQRPQCGRCLKAKRPCDYFKGNIFVLNDSGSHKTKYRKECAVPLSISPGALEDRTPSSIDSQNGAVSEHALTPFSYYEAPPPNKMLQQALIASGISFGDCSRPTAYFGIISSSLAHASDTALYTPALACYALWRGRQDGNPTMVDVSRQLYIRGLMTTQKALANPVSARGDTVLAACHALGLYEALECPEKSKTAYAWHRAACCHLMQLRGPKAHRDGLGHELFVNVRILAILEAIEQGEETYLSDDEWMTVPFEHQDRTMFDRLIDVCALSPAVVVKAHKFASIPPDQMLPLMVSIASDIASLIHRFDTLYLEFAGSRKEEQLFWKPNGLQSGIVHDDEVTSSVLCFQPSLCFPDLDTASILIMYWSSQVSLWIGLGDLSNLAAQLSAVDAFYGAIRDQLGQDIDLCPSAIESKWLEMARKVCGSVAYCTARPALEDGPPRIATAINIVVEGIKNRKVCEKEFAWATRARKEIARRWIRLLDCP